MNGKLVRHWLTGEFQEVPLEGSGIIRRIAPAGGIIKKSGDPWTNCQPNDALGFDAESLDEVLEVDRDHHCQTEYVRDEAGYAPVFRSRQHFHKYLRAHDFAELNSYTFSPRHH